MTRPSTAPPPVTAVLDASGSWLPAQLGEVETLLRRQVDGEHGEALAGAAGKTLAAGGKRLRPLLVLLCAGPRGGAAAVRAAAAIELVHMATLVHDDILDDAPLRRGRPTVAATAGRDVALATGDLLFARAFGMLATPSDGRAIELLGATSVALAKGELMQRQDAFDTSIGEERYLERCRLKTARLFSCACLLGYSAAAGGGGAAADGQGEPGGRAWAALESFGAEIGLAFQLLDDVLDVAGPPERTGKSRGTDLLDGTVTLPLIAAAKVDPTLREADLRDLDPAGADALCERIAATGALEGVRARAVEMVAAAKRRLEDAPFDAEQRRLLNLVADGVVERYS